MALDLPDARCYVEDCGAPADWLAGTLRRCGCREPVDRTICEDHLQAMISFGQRLKCHICRELTAEIVEPVALRRGISAPVFDPPTVPT